MGNILDKLITPGYEDLKCYNLLKELLDNKEFYDAINKGIDKGFVSFFDFDIWKSIQDNYKIDFYKFFEEGNNIGSCYSSAKLISYLNDRAHFCQGYNKFLKNSRNSTNGEHFWAEINGYVYDTSLMLKIDSIYISELGYKLISSKTIDSFVNFDLEKAYCIKGMQNKF